MAILAQFPSEKSKKSTETKKKESCSPNRWACTSLALWMLISTRLFKNHLHNIQCWDKVTRKPKILILVPALDQGWKLQLGFSFAQTVLLPPSTAMDSHKCSRSKKMTVQKASLTGTILYFSSLWSSSVTASSFNSLTTSWTS